MNAYLKYSLTIAVFAGVSGLLLSSINQFTSPRIKAHKLETEISAQKEVLPQADEFIATSNNGTHYKIGLNNDQLPVGYVIKASGTGYSSTIETLIGLDNELTITGIKILSQQETPGLGTKITEVSDNDNEPWFQKQFKNLKYKKLSLKKDGGVIDGITGATISSQAVVKSVRQAIADFESSLNNLQE